jgi:hypothetical protein
MEKDKVCRGEGREFFMVEKDLEDKAIGSTREERKRREK